MMRHAASALAIGSGADAQFLLAAAGLFLPRFLRGATVLLASYDPEPAPVASPERDTATA